jgi:arylsulfatase A-like enzyme
VKGGHAIGATDELGFEAVEEPHHVSDLHATILHLMGLDHEKLTYFYQGLEQRITGVRREVIRKALA